MRKEALKLVFKIDTAMSNEMKIWFKFPRVGDTATANIARTYKSKITPRKRGKLQDLLK